jgi:CheY-like chemotaxis protein
MLEHNPSKNKVMLIDDNAIDLKINSKIISITGHFEQVITFSSAESALTYLHSCLDASSPFPELILLDIQMPEMSGFEFLEHYKCFPEAQKQKCVIAMLSSTLDFGDIQRAEANVYVLKLLKKPLRPADLQALISAL